MVLASNCQWTARVPLDSLLRRAGRLRAAGAYLHQYQRSVPTWAQYETNLMRFSSKRGGCLRAARAYLDHYQRSLHQEKTLFRSTLSTYLVKTSY